MISKITGHLGTSGTHPQDTNPEETTVHSLLNSLCSEFSRGLDFQKEWLLFTLCLPQVLRVAVEVCGGGCTSNCVGNYADETS